MRSQRVLYYLFTTSILLLLAGCRKDLCYEEFHPHARKVWVEVDYSRMDTIPDEMRIDFYSLTTGRHFLRFVTKKNHVVDLPADNYNAVILNDNSEYISLRDEEDYLNIAAHMSPLTRSQYNSVYSGKSVFTSPGKGSSGDEMIGVKVPGIISIDPSVLTIGQPDLFFTDHCSAFAVTEDALKQDTLRFCPEDRTVIYNIWTEVTGMEYVSQARGTLTGVSTGIRLYDEYKDPYTAVVLFDFKKEDNRITASVSSFGFLCNDFHNTPEKQVLNVELLLTNNTVYKASFEINAPQNEEQGKKIVTIALENLVIEKPSSGSGGGFDVAIDDWLNEVTIPVR